MRKFSATLLYPPAWLATYPALQGCLFLRVCYAHIIVLTHLFFFRIQHTNIEAVKESKKSIKVKKDRLLNFMFFIFRS